MPSELLAAQFISDSKLKMFILLLLPSKTNYPLHNENSCLFQVWFETGVGKIIFWPGLIILLLAGMNFFNTDSNLKSSVLNYYKI